MYCNVTIGTCICWSRDTNNNNGGRYKHLVQIHECELPDEIEQQLTLQRETMNDIQGFDEKHRMTTVYEFVVASMNRYERRKNETKKRKLDTSTKLDTSMRLETSIKLDTNTKLDTGTIRKPKPLIHAEQLIRAFRVVSIPVCDPFVRRTCETLKQRSNARAVFVILISDTDIRNWMNALQDYLIPLEDVNTLHRTIHNTDVFCRENATNETDGSTSMMTKITTTTTIPTSSTMISPSFCKTLSPSSSSSSSSTSFATLSDQSSSLPISPLSASTSLDLRDSCELIKSRIQETMYEM